MDRGTEGAGHAAGVGDRYETWLELQPLSQHTRRAYRRQARAFLEFLAGHPAHHGDPLRDPAARRYALEDWRGELLARRGLKPASANQALAAADHLFRFLGGERPAVPRTEAPAGAPRALEPEELKRFLRAVETCPSARDRALATLFLHTGLRLAEATALDLEDVRLSARKGLVVVRRRKGGAGREVPLNAPACEALDAWLRVRERLETTSSAFFLSRSGERLTVRAVDLVLRRLGAGVGLELSAHVLRHTCLTALVRKGADLVLVAEVAGHRRLETTRRYTRPTREDQETALEHLYPSSVPPDNGRSARGTPMSSHPEPFPRLLGDG